MRETSFCFHNLEWPEPHAALSGPVVWLRGWVVAKPGFDCIDLRIRHESAIHLGVLGLPRTDLAAHFKSDKPWLPAEYIIGVPVSDGDCEFTLEVMDAHGLWCELETIKLNITPEGLPPPRVEGRLETSPDGTWTTRDTHYPFQGHLDRPGSNPILIQGRAPLFGWLLDETATISKVLATTDTLVFNHLEHSQTDEVLAVRFPEYPGAHHARLKGTVDYPATLIEPALLRVYAVSSDETVTLCFAQRITARTPTHFVASDILKPPSLPVQDWVNYPSGRPHRALFMVRSLWPDDAYLRALDLVRHLKNSHHWAVRIVALEDGPMRDAFLKIDTESLIVDPGGLFSAPNETIADQQLIQLEKQIRWDHLDAFVTFDPLCGWALPLVKKRGIPTVFDCGIEAPLQPDQAAIPYVQDLIRASWSAADVVCFPSFSVATAQQKIFSETPTEIIPYWHTPGVTVSSDNRASHIAMAPLRTVDWLRRYHPDVAARWRFCQGPECETVREQLNRLDESLNTPAMLIHSNWDVRGLAICLGPLFGRSPLRPILDAMAANIPTITAQTSLIDEYLADSRLPKTSEFNPLVLAHHLIAFDNRRDYLRDETEYTGAHIRKQHAPDPLLNKWESMLSSVSTRHG